MKFYTPKILVTKEFWIRFFKKDNLVKFYIVIWPTIVGLFWSDYNKRVFESTRNIFNWSRSIDLISCSFWTLSILWLFLFFFSVLIEDASTNSKFDRIRATILKAPDMSAFLSAKSNFDFVFEIVENELRSMQPDIQAELDAAEQLKSSGQVLNPSTHLSKKKDLKTALNTINNSILELTKQFFKNSTIDGVNTMLFFKNDSSNSQIIESLMKVSKTVYFRCDHKEDLEGILFIDNGLYSKNGSILNNDPFIMPVYKKYMEVFKNPNEEQIECIIPGAMLAYKLDTSMVGNTRDAKKYYHTLDARTQKEIAEFWHHDPVGKDIRSFASFKTPSPISAPGEGGISILNLDAKEAYAFGEDEEFFATFYTLIYPMLKLYCEYLRLYKEYVKLTY